MVTADLTIGDVVTLGAKDVAQMAIAQQEDSSVKYLFVQRPFFKKVLVAADLHVEANWFPRCLDEEPEPVVHLIFGGLLPKGSRLGQHVAEDFRVKKRDFCGRTSAGTVTANDDVGRVGADGVGGAQQRQQLFHEDLTKLFWPACPFDVVAIPRLEADDRGPDPSLVDQVVERCKVIYVERTVEETTKGYGPLDRE